MKRIHFLLIAVCLISGSTVLCAINVCYANEITNGSFDSSITSPWINNGFQWRSTDGYAEGTIGDTLFQVFQEPDWNPAYNQKIWSASAEMDVNGPGGRIQTAWYYSGSSGDTAPAFSVLDHTEWSFLGSIETFRTATNPSYPELHQIGFSNFLLDTQPRWMAVSIEITGSDINFLAAVDNVYFEGQCVPNGDSNPVPEPTTMLLLCSGLLGLAGFRRKKFKK